LFLRILFSNFPPSPFHCPFRGDVEDPLRSPPPPSPLPPSGRPVRQAFRRNYAWEDGFLEAGKTFPSLPLCVSAKLESITPVSLPFSFLWGVSQNRLRSRTGFFFERLSLFYVPGPFAVARFSCGRRICLGKTVFGLSPPRLFFLLRLRQILWSSLVLFRLFRIPFLLPTLLLEHFSSEGSQMTGKTGLWRDGFSSPKRSFSVAPPFFSLLLIWWSGEVPLPRL